MTRALKLWKDLHFEKKLWDVFGLHLRPRRGPKPVHAEIVRSLKVNRAQVYAAKMYVSKLVKTELAALEVRDR